MTEERSRLLIHDYAGHPFQVQLSRELARRGHEVCHAWCARLQTPRGALARLPDDPRGLSFRPLDLGADFEKYGLWSRWRQEKDYGHLLEEVVEDFRPDAVISGNTPIRSQQMLRRASARRGARFVFWVQDVLGVGIAQALRRRMGPAGMAVGKVLAAMERRVWRASDHVVVISEDFLDYLPGDVRRSRATVIRNWAPLEDMPRRDRDNDWSARQGLSGEPRLIYTGTLGLKHNPGRLEALARRLGESRPGARVLVVSEGPGADYLAGLGLTNLSVLPFQPFEHMPDVLGSADVLIALLEADAGSFAVPSKVLTYLCAGRALLLSVPHRNLARRIVEGAEAGLAVAPDDEAAFLEAAERLLKDGAFRNRLAANARRYAERQFDINDIVDGFERVLAPGGSHG